MTTKKGECMRPCKVGAMCVLKFLQLFKLGVNITKPFINMKTGNGFYSLERFLQLFAFPIKVCMECTKSYIVISRNIT